MFLQTQTQQTVLQGECFQKLSSNMRLGTEPIQWPPQPMSTPLLDRTELKANVCITSYNAP